MLIGLQVWRMFLLNLKGSTDILGPARELSPQSTKVYWLGGLRWMMSTPPLSNSSLWIPIRGWPPLLTWRELPRKWPGNSMNRPESKGNNLIWFELSKNLLTLLNRYHHNCLRIKRNQKVKLLLRSLRQTEEGESSSSANTEREG